MLQEEENLHLPEGFSEDDMGRIDPEMYADVAAIMVEFGQLDAGVDVEESYDTAVWED